MKSSAAKQTKVVRLVTRPLGLPTAAHFEVTRDPLAAVRAGEVLVRNRFFRVSASLRMLISAGAASMRGVPLPAIAPGDALAGEAIGEVVQSEEDGFLPGDVVLHHEGFRDYAVLKASQLAKVDEDLPTLAAHLSHGATAYAALTQGAKVAPGETVLVLGATGAVGSMTAMIAKHLGAGRVIGSTRSKDKVEGLRALGYDSLIAPAPGQALEKLKAVAPEGVDVALDNVGGEMLRAALFAARQGARLIVLGALAGQLAPEGTGRVAPVELDSFPLLLRSVTIRGYSADDSPAARGAWHKIFGAALRAGEMTFPHTLIHGIERAPVAIEETVRGKHMGAVLVEV